MAGLTDGRPTTQQNSDTLYLPVAAGVKIHIGALVALNADGYAQPAKKAENLRAAGCAVNTVDNTGGSAGDGWVNVCRGAWHWDNAAGAGAVTQGHMLQDCYIADDHTVTSVATGSSAAGKVVGICDGQVIVETY